VTFKDAALKAREHYRIEVTEGGAEPVGQIDWSLIPVGRTRKAADRRKPRAMRWREARLALAH
jgi:hypothetical protein